MTGRANGNFYVSGGALIPVTTTGNQPILLSMGTPRGSSTSSRSTPKLAYSLGPCDNQSCVKFNATTGQFNLTKMLNLSSYCAYIKKVQKNPKCAHFSPNFLFKIKIIDYALVLFGPSEAKPQAQESRYTKSKHHVVYRWRCRLNVQLNMVFLTLNALFPCVYEHKENAKQKCTY